MNRPIEFQIWDNQDKEFLDSHMASTVFAIITSGGEGKSFSADTENYKDGRYIPRQYTGIKDRKGQKIFEGDIIKCPWHHNPKHYCVGEVVFWEGAFRLSKGAENKCPEFCPYDLCGGNDTPTRLYFWQNSEVIDNIFETKDLYRITAIAELSQK